MRELTNSIYLNGRAEQESEKEKNRAGKGQESRRGTKETTVKLGGDRLQEWKGPRHWVPREEDRKEPETYNSN